MKVCRYIAGLAAFAALTMLAGCRHTEQEVETSPVKTVRFRAAAADTRTAFADAENGVYRTLWTENDSDVLLSLNYGKAEASAVTPSADGKTASFEVTIDTSVEPAPYTFYAVSPASAARAISPSRSAWSVYIAADQNPTDRSVDEGAQLLVARSEDFPELQEEVDMQFSHLTAYGRISLQNLELGEAKVIKAELLFETPVVGEFYWVQNGMLIPNGASHTITLKTDSSDVLWFACAPVSGSGQTMTLSLFTDLGILTRTITFPEGFFFAAGQVSHFSVDMAQADWKAAPNRYTLILSSDQLSEGSEVVFLDAGGEYAMAGQSKNRNYRESVSSGIDLSGNTLLVTNADVAVFTLEAGTSPGTWAFKGEDGYLASQETDSNYLVTKADKDGYASWSLSFAKDGSVAPEAVEGIRKTLYFYSFSERFSCYRRANDPVKLYLKTGLLPVGDDPLTAKSDYGCYLAPVERTYVRGTDQLARSYVDGKLEFVIMNAAEKEQLVISGFDPSLAKGASVQVSVHYRKGTQTLLRRKCTLSVVKEDGSKVWLGDGSGQGLIIKK